MRSACGSTLRAALRLVAIGLLGAACSGASGHRPPQAAAFAPAARHSNQLVAENAASAGPAAVEEVRGETDARPLPPEAPRRLPPQSVSPTQLEGLRISGDRHIVPDPVTKIDIQRSGKEKLIGAFRLCINSDGKIARVSQIKSTGFPAYDAKLRRGLRTWRYRPYMFEGKAIPVCSAVTFVYT